MTSSIEKAKSFLAARIGDEAAREGKPLNEVETRMLGFSEPSASARDMEIAQEFERDYDDAEYEDRIARLVRSAYDRDVNDGRKPEWDQAMDDLADEDLYLHVMLEKAKLMKTTTSLLLPDWRLLFGLLPVLICIALAGFVAMAPWASRMIPNSFLRLGICILFLVAPFAIGRLGKRRVH